MSDNHVVSVVAVSDLHGHLLPIPECDLLVLTGDICPIASAGEQRKWLEMTFLPWLSRQPVRNVVAVAGNHDLIFDKQPEYARSLPWTYLENEAAEVCGIKIWGSPLSVTFGPFPFMRSDAALSEVWSEIPEDTEMILVHGPAYGYGDIVRYPGGRDPHQGSHSLQNRISYGALPKLRVLINGHIHEGFGRYDDGKVTYINAAHVNERMVPQNPVVAFDFNVTDSVL